MSDAYSPRRTGSSKLTQRLLVALVGVLILVAAGWLTLVIATRVDDLLFPGRTLSLPVSVPGVEDDGDGLEDRINFLVLGLDRRPHEGDAPTRTDTMIIVTIDPKTKTAKMLGIPRDWWVEIPYKNGNGYYHDRVNTAYVIGELEEYPGGGIGLVTEVLKHNLHLDEYGVSLDDHVVIDFEAFVGLIDSLGGIDVYVPEEINDPRYSHTEDPGDYLPLHFEVGMHHMNGTYALGYARTRYNNSDLDRIQRQQRVIFAAIEKATALDLLHPDKLLELWGEFKDTIETDVSDVQIPGLADLATQIEEANIVGYSIGHATVNYTTAQGASVLIADDELVRRMVAEVFADQVAEGEQALVEVQNGTGGDGMAASAVEYLTTSGVEGAQLSAGNPTDGQVRPLTEIVDFSGKPETVQRLATLLNVPANRIRQAGATDAALRNGPTTDVVVILGAETLDHPFGSSATPTPEE
ncbi:MAG: LCP family protein [Dehalococcoidia bacterium]